jgi:hypothetical protein
LILCRLDQLSKNAWEMILQFFSAVRKQSQFCSDRIEDSCDGCGKNLCDFSWLSSNVEVPDDGFGLILEKDFQRLWRVVEIKRNSPADTDDIELNDVVLTVNSRPMKVLPLPPHLHF